jgi:membrane protein DedA with SNARE-associated domain
MPISSAVANYGLLGIGVGAGVEGEPFAMAGGVLAHGGLFSLWMAILTAIAGGWAVDQFWFLFSRNVRDHRWVRAITRRPSFARALRQIEQRQTSFIFVFRFAYGIRAVAPVALGLSAVQYRRYLIVTLLSACPWGAFYTVTGYAFGAPIEAWYAHASGTAVGVAAALAVLLSVAATAFSLRGRKA